VAGEKSGVVGFWVTDVRERKAGILGTAGQRRRDVGEVGYRGSTLIREASAVRRTPLSGHSRLNDYNRVG
jgi:hypothetical protein